MIRLLAAILCGAGMVSCTIRVPANVYLRQPVPQVADEPVVAGPVSDEEQLAEASTRAVSSLLVLGALGVTALVRKIKE